MLSVTQTWNGPQAVQAVILDGWQGIVRCTLFLWERCSLAVGISNPRPYRTPSQPGEPPRLRTGWGQRNIAYELDQAAGIGRVGVRVNAKYMAMLDQGTKHIRPRPWLWAIAAKHMPQLEALAKAGRKP